MPMVVAAVYGLMVSVPLLCNLSVPASVTLSDTKVMSLVDAVMELPAL